MTELLSRRGQVKRECHCCSEMEVLFVNQDGQSSFTRENKNEEENDRSYKAQSKRNNVLYGLLSMASHGEITAERFPAGKLHHCYRRLFPPASPLACSWDLVFKAILVLCLGFARGFLAGTSDFRKLPRAFCCLGLRATDMETLVTLGRGWEGIAGVLVSISFA